jgi:hypothetical protein
MRLSVVRGSLSDGMRGGEESVRGLGGMCIIG